ncbi:MAG: hypothetical protein HKO53_14860, partial [Gemmatimonadetes bacterium]|nr:hypothetical protein [Gemmatimonadota bacterium]
MHSHVVPVALFVALATIQSPDLGAQATQKDVWRDGVPRAPPVSFGDFIQAEEARTAGWLKGALLGAALGGGAGLWLEAVARPDLCDPADNTEHVTCAHHGPSAAETMVVG